MEKGISDTHNDEINTGTSFGTNFEEHQQKSKVRSTSDTQFDDDDVAHKSHLDKPHRSASETGRVNTSKQSKCVKMRSKNTRPRKKGRVVNENADTVTLTKKKVGKLSSRKTSSSPDKGNSELAAPSEHEKLSTSSTSSSEGLDSPMESEDGSKSKQDLSEKDETEGKDAKQDDEKDTEEEEEAQYTPPSRQKKDSETTETETDDSDKEDFPTEGLLKELHFLNAR